MARVGMRGYPRYQMSTTARVAAPQTRAVCVVRDPALRRTLRRSLAGTGSPVEFRETVEMEDVGPETILFIDRASREGAELPALIQVMGESGRVVVLGESLADLGLVELLRATSMDHLISEGAPEEVELVVTSQKLLSGDIFGLEKYLSWGAMTNEVEVGTYEQKREALSTIGRAAESVGASRRVSTKIESAADELLMNALYDAPAVASGVARPRRAGSVPPTAPLDENGKTALMRYACDGRHFAVSVLDRYGLLDKKRILDSVLRARNEQGRPIEVGNGGAGLGLYFVLSSVTRFIVNIEPRVQTEVICLFDLRERGRDAEGWARSLHIFTAGQ
jgi:hypothetical protein